MVEIAEQVSQRDLDIVGIQESWEKEGGGNRMESWRVPMDIEEAEVKGGGGAEVLSRTTHLCDIL